MVSIILVNYNGAHFVVECLRSIYDHTRGCQFEVIVVDNASTDRSVEFIRELFPQTKLLANGENLGYSRGNNLGAGAAKGSKILFLNADTVLVNDAVSILAECLDSRSNVAVVGPKLMFEDLSYQLSAGRLPNIFVESLDKIRYRLDRRFHSAMAPVNNTLSSNKKIVDWVTGACMIVRREAFEKVNGFDENFFMYFEDKDLCKRIGEAGWKVAYCPEARVIHLLGASVTSNGWVNKHYRDSQLYYYQKHLSRFQERILMLYLKISGKT